MRRVRLTTVDNPYDPFKEFTDWLMYDKEKGYNSCEYLARIAKTSDQLSDEENEKEIERAINEIIFKNPLNIYKKVILKEKDSKENEKESTIE